MESGPFDHALCVAGCMVWCVVLLIEMYIVVHVEFEQGVDKCTVILPTEREQVECYSIWGLNSLHAVSHYSGYYVIIPLRHKPL